MEHRTEVLIDLAEESLRVSLEFAVLFLLVEERV